MSILNNIGKRVSDTAKTAAKKSGDIVEATKLNMSIAAEEDKIKKVFLSIGKTLYDSYKEGKQVPEPVESDCETIRAIEASIEEMKQKILELRDIKVCPACGTELQMEMAYCFRCGVMQEVVKDKGESSKEEEESEPEEEYEDGAEKEEQQDK